MHTLLLLYEAVHLSYHSSFYYVTVISAFISYLDDVVGNFLEHWEHLIISI